MDSTLLEDLRAEQQVLHELLSGLDSATWDAPTPAEGWTIADTVRHLTVAEHAATASVRDRRDFIDTLGSDPPTVPASQPAPALSPADLLQQWRQARESTLDALEATDDAERVPWGGRLMGVRSLATARLMETWAHGLDCFAAAGREPVDTDRLRHVAWLGWRTLPYAFAIAEVTPPAPIDELRLELTAPSGDRWTFGAESAPHVIEGHAAAWCRVATRRWRSFDPPPLVADSDLAAAALRVAQAYLDA